MQHSLLDAFHWLDLSDDVPYPALVEWGSKARGKNPDAFDAVTRWLLDDAQWNEETLPENRLLLMQLVARFQTQTAFLIRRLRALEPAGEVNPPVFPALHRLKDELSGQTHAPELKDAVSRLFADPSALLDRTLRRRIAGGVTGSTGTDAVDFFGYVNGLKDCDASVQWALFMPETVKRQQKGFTVASFEYKKLPAMRFIGRGGEQFNGLQTRRALFQTLDALSDYLSEWPYDVILIHHGGQCVDVADCHVLWGRFMHPDTPVPDGFEYIDFVPARTGGFGAPYISQFAYAVFTGDADAMHRREGFDSDAMYDVTRNIMLAQGAAIPYPDKYWVAEVFPDGHEKPGSAYMFSAEL